MVYITFILTVISAFGAGWYAHAAHIERNARRDEHEGE